MYILVCAPVRTCDDPLESFNVCNLLAGTHEDAVSGSPVSLLFEKMFQFANKDDTVGIVIIKPEFDGCVELFYYAYRVRVFGELRKPSNSYKINVRIFKAHMHS